MPLRAALGNTEITDVAWEIDGAPLPSASWTVTPGEHRVVAIWQGRRSRPAHVRVDAAGR